MEGKPRTARSYTPYRTCPLPTRHDRLLFLLSYMKAASLPVVHAALFDMSPSNANKWIHILLVVMHHPLRDVGDAPARHLDDIANQHGIRWVAYGENVDDLGDHRPGARAAGEHGVRAPLKKAGLSKADIRALAQQLGLPVWNKPAFACLGSRFPYGTTITPEKLAQVEATEEVLWELGFRQYRVRHHGEVARIEVDAADMPRLMEHAAEVVARFRSEARFVHVTMDLAGYRRGSMNEAATTATIQLVEV